MDVFHRLFADQANVAAGMSFRKDGDMRICAANDAVRADALTRRRAYLDGQLPKHTIAAPLLVHGVSVAVVTGLESPWNGNALFHRTDALVTAAPGVALTVTAADCLPILFFDTNRRIIGIAHAGWRGLVAPDGGVLAATVATLVGLGASPEHLRVEIGPSIGPCHYPVRNDVRDAVRRVVGDSAFVGDAVDLRRVAIHVLADLGVPAAAIATDSPCTVCAQDRFFSYRVDGANPPLAGMAWIAMQRPG